MLLLPAGCLRFNVVPDESEAAIIAIIWSSSPVVAHRAPAFLCVWRLFLQGSLQPRRGDGLRQRAVGAQKVQPEQRERRR